MPSRAYHYRRDQEGVPIEVAAGRRSEPFGDDFAVWYNEAIDRGYISDEPVAVDDSEGGGFPIADAAVRLSPDYVASRSTPLYEAHYTSFGPPNGSHVRTSEPVFDPVREAPPEAFVPIEREDIDPTRAWAEAEQRADQRWRSGRPSTADMVFAAIFGNRGIFGPEVRARRELQQMRTEVRNDQR